MPQGGLDTCMGLFRTHKDIEATLQADNGTAVIEIANNEDDEIAAVITAALLAYLSDAGSMNYLVVRPLKRTSDTWMAASRMENTR